MQGQLLWGTATIASRPGTTNMGVFGYIIPFAGGTVAWLLGCR
jgi:hypothetical protein